MTDDANLALNNDEIRLTTEDGEAPETVKPGPGEPTEEQVLLAQAGGRISRGGRF